MRRVLAVLGLVVLAAGVWIAIAVTDRPNVRAYRFMDTAAAGGSGLRVMFFGVTTLVFYDGDTAIMTDGFFSRPSLFALARRIAPDRERIRADLAAAGISRLAAVIPVHSHYDHAMDAPEVARVTGAALLGSESTANIGRGDGLPEAQIRVVRDGERIAFGRFRVTMILSRHFPHGVAMGEIRSPLTPPARATAYLDGGAYSVLIEHEGKSILIQGSAGYVQGRLVGRHADVVFLGIAGLSRMDEGYRAAYWREVVEAVKPSRVVPIHWDDFTRPLHEPLVAFPRFFDDLDVSMEFILARAREQVIDVRFAHPWVPFEP